jgi:hypothetical protein
MCTSVSWTRMSRIMKGRKLSNSGKFGWTDTRYGPAPLSRYTQSLHIAFATLCTPGCGYQAVTVVRGRPLRCCECPFGLTYHCGAGSVLGLGIWKTVDDKAYFTQLSQWNSNSSRAVFDFMFRSFLEIVTSDTVEDLLYKA